MHPVFHYIDIYENRQSILALTFKIREHNKISTKRHPQLGAFLLYIKRRKHYT